jgi:hypothetical protein
LPADKFGMTSAKKDRSLPLVPDWLKRLIALLWGPGRTATLICLLLAGSVVGTSLVWAGVKHHVLSSGRFRVTQQHVTITPLPGWIHSDVRADVFRNASLDGGPSILDDDLAERIDRAFALHPWIEKVVRVAKRPPDEIEVDLVYRRPACMVEVPGDLLPVDGAGVLLPSGDFSPNEKQSQYLRLGGISTRPMGPAGQRWGDGRVVGGAEIAAALAAAWQQLRLFRIEPSLQPGAAPGEACRYVLFTNAGTQIVWGLAPGAKIPGELSAEEKVARLVQYAADHGSLEGRGGAQALDVRMLPAPQKR